MSNPTSNFGWQMPTPTDLVTDLPADFEVFGQAVDSTMADLKGGTSGQILSKNSNTDMDFVWTSPNPGDITGVTAGTGISGGGTSGDVTITNSMATAIDAKGDLIGGTGADAFARLAVGTNGQVLTADSAAATGLAWASPSSGSSYVAGKNFLFNGAMDIWQRGTSITTAGGYTADRWQQYTSGAQTTSRQTTSDTTNLPQIQYCARVQRNSGSTSTGVFALGTSLENVMTTPMVGQTVTLSFYARKGANFSGASSQIVVQLIAGTGTDQNVISGFTGVSLLVANTATLTSTWQRFTYTAAVGSTFTQLGLQTYFLGVGTAGANDFYEITGFQLEIGSSATAFSRAAGNIAGELAACQRYYNRYTAPQAYSHFAQGWAISTDNMTAWFYLPVEMRTVPTAIDYASVNMGDGVNAQITPSTITFTADNNNTKAIACTGTKSAGGMTQYRGYQFLAAGTTAAYIGFSAEL